MPLMIYLRSLIVQTDLFRKSTPSVPYSLLFHLTSSHSSLVFNEYNIYIYICRYIIETLSVYFGPINTEIFESKDHV